MAYSYNDYVSGTNSDGTSYTVTTSTVFASPPYLSGRGASDVTVTVDGVIKVKDTDYTITNTEVKFLVAKIPPAGAKIRISRNSSQGQRITDYSDASLLNADTMDADANQLFFIAQEALDTASETNIAVATFYSSGTSAPASAKAGDLFFNTSTGLLQIYTGSAWESINNRGTKQTFAISGSTTVFTPSTPVDDNTLVFLNGVLLVKGSGSAGDYTTSSTQVTLNTAVTSGVVEVVTFPNATNNTFTGTVTADGLTLGDNQAATFNGKLEIKSNGNDSTITETGSGSLIIKGENFVVKNASDQNLIVGLSSLQLFGAGERRMQTVGAGIAVEGTDSLGGQLTLREANYENAGEHKVTFRPASENWAGNYDITVPVTGNGSMVVADSSGNVNVTGTVDCDGLTVSSSAPSPSISIQDTDASGAFVIAQYNSGDGVFTIDSAEKFRVKSTGINVTGDVAATTVTVGDSTGTNLELYEDSSQNAIIKQRGTGGLQISGVNGSLANDNYAQLVSWDADNVNLSWQGASGAGTKLSTSETGIDVTGSVTPSGGYKSSDGTAGFTGSASASATLTIKDGLIVAVS